MTAFPEKTSKQAVGLEDARKDLVMLLAGINRSLNGPATSLRWGTGAPRATGVQ